MTTKLLLVEYTFRSSADVAEQLSVHFNDVTPDIFVGPDPVTYPFAQVLAGQLNCKISGTLVPANHEGDYVEFAASIIRHLDSLKGDAPKILVAEAKTLDAVSRACANAPGLMECVLVSK